MAGVRYLTKAENAIVVDMGGTTTDIAGLENGGVRLCSEGARVGSARMVSCTLGCACVATGTARHIAKIPLNPTRPHFVTS